MKWLRSWIETIKVMRNRELMSDLKTAREEFERGETIPWKC